MVAKGTGETWSEDTYKVSLERNDFKSSVVQDGGHDQK
jgi:hypothetical protein